MENYADLGVTYDFFTLLSSVYLPTVDGQVLIYKNSLGNIAGVASYTSGTSEQGYEDEHHAEIQIAYLDKEHRVTRAFIDGLKCLAETALRDPKNLVCFTFYAPALRRYRKLFGRFAVVETSSRQLDYYTMEISSLVHYSTAL